MPALSFAFLRRPRAIALSAALILQTAVLFGVSRQENLPVAKPLAGFPAEVGDWRLAQEIPIDGETLTALRADDTMSRYYLTPSGARPVTLFTAYFRSQRKGQTPHSPKNCLPGTGWQPSDSGTLAVAVPGEPRSIVVNRYVVSKGDAKSVVLYWYQSRNRVIASEYQAKMFLVADAIRYNRTDTALVRIVAPVAGGDEAGASAAAAEFVRAVYPMLKERLPS